MGAAASSHTHTHTHSFNCCMCWWWSSPTPTTTSTPTPTPSTAAAAALECMRSLCGLSIDKTHRQRAVAVAVAAAVVVVVAASADSCIYCFARPLALHGVKRAQKHGEKKNNQLNWTPSRTQVCGAFFVDMNLAETILRAPTPTETWTWQQTTRSSCYSMVLSSLAAGRKVPKALPIIGLIRHFLGVN